MNITDIVALAKQGYKPSDIKELIALASEPEPQPIEPEPQASESEPTTSEQNVVEPEPKNNGKIEEPNAKEPEVNEEVEKLKAQIKDLQDKNSRVDNSGNQPSNDDILADMIRGFM